VVLGGQGKEKEPEDLVVRSLTVKGEDGMAQVKLTASAGDARLRLISKDEKASAGISVSRIGSAHLWLCGGLKKQQIDFFLPSRGFTHLILSENDGATRASLGINTEDRPFLALEHREDGAAALGLGPGRTSRLVLADKSHKPRATFVLSEEGEPSLTMFDANGKVIWKAPGE
ncbi:MAG: hypothetical protein ACYS0K_24100, partial [Planctomycetota bacterium]|jgi:hypothetical protein